MIKLLDKTLWLIAYIITLPLNIAFALVDLLVEVIFVLADVVRKAIRNKRFKQVHK